LNKDILPGLEAGYLFESGEPEMPYDASKDQALETWENQKTGLLLTIYRYGEGEPKLQIGPRTYTKRDGSKGTTKAGRLSIDDVLWLTEIIDDIKGKLDEYYLEEA
jgi:hypothetical protein